MGLERYSYPFSAIVGQEKMKLALILNAINPSIGGVLIRGEKGTGKSTAVRALARLLPEQEVVTGCHYGCNPQDWEGLCIDCKDRIKNQDDISLREGLPRRSRGMEGLREDSILNSPHLTSPGRGGLPTSKRQMRVVELPINASEDRVVGTIDIEAALTQGSKHFEPGVLAEANRNILYVDEVNLLDDHIVDVLLDAAAMGVNVVEREGVSIMHPARFILVGTMNPEEGELRPQLLDRFGLCVDVEGIRDPEQRVTLMQRANDFQNNQADFLNQFEVADKELSKQIAQAMQKLDAVALKPQQTQLVSQICLQAGVEGHRADLVIERTARALASFHNHNCNHQEILEASDLALAHRRRRSQTQPSKYPTSENSQNNPAHSESQSCQSQSQSSEPTPNGKPGESEQSASSSRQAQTSESQSGFGVSLEGQREETTSSAEELFQTKKIELPKQRNLKKPQGKRSLSPSPDRRGRYFQAQRPAKISDLAVDATLRAAAPHQIRRGRQFGDRLLLEKHDLRQKMRQRKVGHLIVFVVDASASMDAEQRMAATKGAILSLLQDAYLRRDRVAVVIFKNRSAGVVLRPTSSVSLAQKKLEKLSVGGTTPLTHGLIAGFNVIKSELLRDPSIKPLLVLISDGRGNISMFKEEPLVEAQKAASFIKSENIDSLVIDSARDFSHLPSIQNLARIAPHYQTYAINACADLAERMGATYYGLYDLSREEITSVVETKLSKRKQVAKKSKES